MLSTPTDLIANEGQAEAWNGPEAAHFVDHADRYDRQLEPFTRALLERAGPDPGRVVLDVGCGSGATTLAAAATAERAVGVDCRGRSWSWHGAERGVRRSPTRSS